MSKQKLFFESCKYVLVRKFLKIDKIENLLATPNMRIIGNIVCSFRFESYDSNL